MNRSVAARLTSVLFVATVSVYAFTASQRSGQDASDSLAPLFGFTEERGARQRLVEARLLGIPSPARAESAHQLLTAEPHVAGSPRDHALARWVRDRWREYGLDEVSIVAHEVLLPYPREVSVEMTAPRAWRASMKEDPIPGDPSTLRTDVGIPYHAYSASGDVTAEAVYAGSGNPSEYDWLERQGIDVKGKIVIVRYSVPYSYRGFKALTAQGRGAAGILIYSDPADDGYAKGKTYPDGPWGPESHIQRGGVVYDFIVPGDPLTPGWASVRGAKRIPASESLSLPHIMSAPLSYRDARVILEALGGPASPETWHGALPIRYRVGPGPATVRLRIRNDDAVRPIWTVVGKIRGSDRPREQVIVGNHRDAWIFGGVDPSSGSASMMELARALGSMAKRGVRPRRTIVFASWDAEEFTLTSSTEWGEQHAQDLRAHAVAYLNVDSSTSGSRFTAAAVPSLNRLVLESLERVPSPGGGTLGDAVRAAAAAPPEPGALPTGGGAMAINNRLGSGSDYTVFLNFLGVPIVDMSFDGPYGVYHSMYDSHAWMKRFGDPGFRYHTTMAQLWGVMALRLANADVLPFDIANYVKTIRTFVAEARESASWSRREDELFAPLVAALNRLTEAAAAIDRERDRLLATARPNAAELDGLNARLMAFERALLDPDGIPRRPWYKHQIYAPKFTYAPELLPAIARANDAKDEAALEDAIGTLISALDRAVDFLLKRG